VLGAWRGHRGNMSGIGPGGGSRLGGEYSRCPKTGCRGEEGLPDSGGGLLGAGSGGFYRPVLCFTAGCWSGMADGAGFLKPPTSTLTVVTKTPVL